MGPAKKKKKKYDVPMLEFPAEKSFFKKVYNFLLVEDDPILERLYETKLRMMGQKVQSTTSGLAALDMATRDRRDFILCDINLADMNGIELLTKFKERGVLTPVIVLTNNDDPATKTKALELGAKDYIIKSSAIPKHVMERVRDVLEGPR